MEQEQANKGIKELFMKFLLWRDRHIKERNFVLVLAFVVGIFSGLAAIVLKFLIHFISTVLTATIFIFCCRLSEWY